MFPKASAIFKYMWFAFGFAMLYLVIFPVTFTPSIALAILSTSIGSLALAIKTAKENYGHDCTLYTWVASFGERWALWYDGGNSVYDPAYPFTMDMWHLLRDLAVYTAMATAVFATGSTFWFVIPFIENAIFLTKSTLFKDGTFPLTDLIKKTFSTENWHKTN